MVASAHPAGLLEDHVAQMRPSHGALGLVGAVAMCEVHTETDPAAQRGTRLLDKLWRVGHDRWSRHARPCGGAA